MGRRGEVCMIAYSTILTITFVYQMQDSVANFTCLCAEGYTGPQCDDDIDYCTFQPCMNNGTCTVIFIVKHFLVIMAPCK